MTRNYLRVAFYRGAIDGDCVPTLVTERLVDRVLADLEEDDSDDQTDLNESANQWDRYGL